VTTSSGKATSRIADACVNVTRQNNFGGRFEVANSRRGRKPESDGDAGGGGWCCVRLGSIARGLDERGEDKDVLSGEQTVDVIRRRYY